MRDLAEVQALVFDVFGTVVDWRSGVARESAAFLARYAPGVDPAAFADAWRRRYSPAMEEVRSGVVPSLGWMFCTGKTSKQCCRNLRSIPPRFPLPSWMR